MLLAGVVYFMIDNLFFYLFHRYLIILLSQSVSEVIRFICSIFLT